MGRPKKDSKEKKSESYRIRLTKKDKRMLNTAAKDLGYLHMWTKRNLFLPDLFVGSNFEPYSEDDQRPRKE